MADGPQYELQVLLTSTIKGNSPVMALLGGVYDRVPADPWKGKTAYVSFGPSDVLDDGADCILSGVHTFQIDVWSKAVGQTEAKRLVDMIYRLLHEQEFELADSALAEIRVDLRRVFPDRDPLISHGVLSVTASIEELE